MPDILCGNRKFYPSLGRNQKWAYLSSQDEYVDKEKTCPCWPMPVKDVLIMDVTNAEPIGDDGKLLLR